MIKLQILEFDAAMKLTTESLIWTIALYSEIEGTAKIKEAVPTIQESILFMNKQTLHRYSQFLRMHS